MFTIDQASQGEAGAGTGQAAHSTGQGGEALVKLPRLRALREAAFMTQVELAEKAGISEGSIKRLEKGQTGVRFSTIRKLAAALGATPEELTRPANTGEQDE